MRLLRSFLPLLLLLSVATAVAKSPELVMVNGKKCVVHTIAEGDTLYSLAKYYEVPLRQIVELNSGVEADKLSLGTELYIPYNAKAYKRIKAEAAAAPAGDFVDYTVEAGDTLYSIAAFHKMELDDLVADNKGITPTTLAVGSKLKVRKSLIGSAIGRNIEVETNAESTTAADIEAYEAAITEPVAEEVAVAEEAEGAEVVNVDEVAVADEATDLDQVANLDEVAVAEEPEMDPAEREFLAFVESIEQSYNVTLPTFQRFEKGEVLNVALMLPMHRNGKVVGAFVDFYRGSLLALEDLRRQGYSVNVSVYDTERSALKISEIVESEGFAQTNLVIGPVYADELALVLPYAEERNIPVVTPLSDISPEELTSPVLFQMQADSEHKYDKYAHLLDGSYQINIIYGPTNDNAYLQDVLQATKHLKVRHINAEMGNRGAVYSLRKSDGTNGASFSASELTPADGKSVVFIVADRDYHIEKVLQSLGELVKKKQRGKHDCVVVGNRKWDGLDYMERTGMFQTATSLLATYNSKRTDNNAIRVFESRFLTAYGILPTPYACRGYDAMMMFCTKMFTGLDKYIMLESITPLATTYKFKFEGGMFVNTEWVNIQYQRDFTITYE